MSFLFCNIGWMEFYQGIGHNDKIRGGGAYVREKGRCNEVCNFVDINGTVYGFARAPGTKINIDRLGADRDDEFVSGITVVWTAARPNWGTVIVGWYENATVFRNYQKHQNLPKLHKKNGVDGFWIKASSKDAKLLTVDERICKIPKRIKGGMGQSNIWYADSPEAIQTVARASDFISEKGRVSSVKRNLHSTKPQDQDRKVQIERIAIQVCRDHFEALGYSLISVEKDNVGWDLIAKSENGYLNIEVKGLSGENFSIGLTPNEYKAFDAKSENYRLAVVVSALDNPALFVCRYSKEQGDWIVDGQSNGGLEVEVRESAVIRYRQ